MGDFSAPVGFIFSFIVFIFIVGGSFYAYEYMLFDQVKVLDSAEKFNSERDFYSLVFSKASLENDKLEIFFENRGSGFSLGENFSDCLDIYLDGDYLSDDVFESYVIGPVNNYYFIDEGEKLALNIYGDFNLSERNKLVVVDCIGRKVSYILDDVSDYGWANYDYNGRVQFKVSNDKSFDLVGEYFDIELNSSNFDFSKGDKGSLEFYLPIYENKVLGIDFNNYSQKLEDNSKYGHNVYLGSDSSVESYDPVSSEGILFDGVYLSGSGFMDVDFLTVDYSDALNFTDEVTVSYWVRKLDTGFNSFLLDYNVDMRFYVETDGTLEYTLKTTTDNYVITSSKNMSFDDWHHVVATYNSSNIILYVDSQKVAQIPANGTIISSGYIRMGTEGLSPFYGYIDEVEFYNIALDENEVKDLYEGSLFYRELDYVINSWDNVSEVANISVKIPYIRGYDSIGFELYYDRSFGEDFDSLESDQSIPFVPSPINDLSAISDFNRVDLSWTAPDSKGYPILNYVVEYGTISSGLFNYTYVDDNIVGATINGLENEVGYQFRVYAVSSQGNAPYSNVVTSTPSGSFWITEDLSTNLGFDGIANQGTVPPTYAQLLYGNVSSSASSCIGDRMNMVNYIIANEYTPIFDSGINIAANSSATISVDGNTNPVEWRATLYEYNDTTGDISGPLGVAINSTSASNLVTLNMSFNNTDFTISPGNRIKIVLDATNGGNKFTYLCYGTGSQSYFKFNKI